LVDDGVSSQSEASKLHEKLQNRYEHVEQPKIQLAYIELAKEWNSLVEWNPMDSEGEQGKFNSGDKNGMSREDEEPEILTILDEETVQKVVATNEPRASQFLAIQDEECGHTKWLDTHNIKKDDYTTMSQEGRVQGDADCIIEPCHVIAVGLAYNNYVGTEWIMANGLKVIVRQGDLVDVEAEVIVNPASSELCHGGGAARAISVATRKKLDDECNEYIRRFGSLKIGKVMCTTAGSTHYLSQFKASNKARDSCCRAEGS